MRLWLLSLVIFSGLVQAETEILSLRNVREGQTFYSKRVDTYIKERALDKISGAKTVRLFREALKKQDARNACAYTLLSDFQALVQEKVSHKGLIYILREENEIDDVVAGILLKALKTTSTEVVLPDPEADYYPPKGSEANKEILKLIGSFEKRFAKDTCFDAAYRSFYAEVMKQDKKLKKRNFAHLLEEAFRTKLISEELYVTLEQARENELQTSGLSLSSYLSKVKTLRIQYPLRDVNERSDFTGGSIKKAHMSRRQKLFEQYSDLQIIMMANIVKTLRADLESSKIEILVYEKEEVRRKLELEPMERFRFAIKSLRKEMSRLALNTYFNGRSPDYVDLMVASYEIGIIPASELDAVASLEEIWNPKKTFWDKAGIWVKTFASISTIVIPPPYGFIPALALVVIEATVAKKKDPNTNDPSVLF